MPMKNTLTLTLENERAPSRNRTSRSHWSARHREYRRIKSLVRNALPRVVVEGEGFPLREPCRIIVHAYEAGNVQDHDNVDTKPYVDGLKTWVILDDNPECVLGIEGRTHKAGKAGERVVVEVTW